MSRRHLSPLLAVLILVLAGCGKPKSLAGQWADEEGDTKSALTLAQDGTFAMVTGNSFAVGILQGSYSQTSDTLTLSSDRQFSMPPIAMKYKWVGSDQIAMQAPSGDQKEIVWKLIGPPAKTARIDPSKPGSSAADAFSGSVSPAKVDSTSCLANLKQTATATLLYVQDYDGYFPIGNWADELYPYAKTKSIFSCPTLQKANKEGGYAMDSALLGASLARLQSAASTVLFFESTTEALGAADPQTSLLKTPRHDKINFAYADGHVKAKSP